jgi:hypothetical protein
MVHGEQRTVILATPATIQAIVAKAEWKTKRPAYFVSGGTELRTGPDTYLPITPDVRVTRRAMLDYLDEITGTATRRKDNRGDHVEIELSIYGHCYFV